jgi:hypothetical protein
MLTFLMLILIVLAVVLAKKQNQPGAAGCAVLVVILVIFKSASPLWSGTAGERNFEKARQVMCSGVAKKVADRYPDSKVVILGQQNGPASSGTRELVSQLAKGLKKGGMAVEVMDFPSTATSDFADPQPGDGFGPVELPPEWAPELDPKLAPTAVWDMALANIEPLYDLLLELNGSVDVVIITIPLSLDMAPEDLPASGESPHLVLMDPPDWIDLQSVMEKTALDAVLMYRPSAAKLVTKKWPKNDEKAFDQRFQLLTPQNPILLK